MEGGEGVQVSPIVLMFGLNILYPFNSCRLYPYNSGLYPRISILNIPLDFSGVSHIPIIF